VKLRRQVPIGRNIVDFLCEEKKLIIELDGSQHYEAEGIARDKARDDHLHSKGYTTLRIDNLDVLKFTDSVLMEIASYLQQEVRTSVPKKSPK
jgi:very-short-patch-repair endonuclease